MKPIERFRLFLRILTVLAASAFMSAHAQTFDMKLTAPTINDPLHEYIKEFAKKIEAKTAGRIKPQVFPAGQLGPLPRMVEGVGMGQVEMLVLPPDFLKGISPGFEVVSAPGVFRNHDHANAVFKDPEFATAYNAQAEAQGFTVMSLIAGGQAKYMMRKPVRRLADLKGMKIRVLASDVEREAMNALGATGVPMPYGEVMPALAQGVVDGARTGWTGPAFSKWMEVAKFATASHEAIVCIVVVVSKRWLDRLPADLRTAVLDTGREQDGWFRTLHRDFDLVTSRDAWVKGGGEVIELPEADRNELAQKMKNVARDVFSRNAKQKEMYELLLRVSAKH